jgi:hypothetical protein
MRRLITGLLAGSLATLVVAVAPSAVADSTTSAWTTPALTSPQTIQITDHTRNLKLNQSQDYILRCDNTGPLTWGLVVWGGHNVVIDGCDYNQGSSVSGAAAFKNQTGTLYLHDIHFQGTALTEGIDLQEPGATTVVMRDILIDEVHGSYSTNHADCVQAWAGPQRLLIDGLTCTSQYQGLFLLPNQHDSTTQPTAWDLRNIDITASAYSLWIGDLNEGTFPTWNVTNVYTPGNTQYWDGIKDSGQAWANASSATPPSGGHYVWATPTGAAGIDEPNNPTPLAGEQ